MVQPVRADRLAGLEAGPDRCERIIGIERGQRRGRCSVRAGQAAKPVEEDLGPAGAGSLAQVVNAAIGNKDRMDRMRSFFEGVGTGDTAGIWEGEPNLRPDFRSQTLKKLEKRDRAAKAQQMI